MKDKITKEEQKEIKEREKILFINIEEETWQREELNIRKAEEDKREFGDIVLKKY